MTVEEEAARPLVVRHAGEAMFAALGITDEQLGVITKRSKQNPRISAVQVGQGINYTLQ